MPVSPATVPTGPAVRCEACGTFTYTDDPTRPCHACTATATTPVVVTRCAEPSSCLSPYHSRSLGVHVWPWEPQRQEDRR
jgi:hypothetical protein